MNYPRASGRRPFFCLLFLFSLLSLARAGEPTVWADEPWNALANWTQSSAGTVEISPAGQLHLESSSNTVAQVSRVLPVPSVYTFTTRLKIDSFGSEIALSVYDGLFRLQVYFTSTGVKVRNSSNTLVQLHAWSSDTNWHDYRFEVNNGQAEVLVDNISKGTVSLHAFLANNQIQYWAKGSTTTSYRVDQTRLVGLPTTPLGVILNDACGSLATWTRSASGISEINPAGVLRLEASTTSVTEAYQTPVIPSIYIFETRHKVDSFGSEVGIVIYDGTYRLQVYFNSTGIRIRNSSGALTLMHAWSSDTSWHTYRFEVNNGVADFFLDEALVGSINIQPNATADKLQYWVKGPALGSCRIDQAWLYTGFYSYSEGFSSYANNVSPDFWMESGYQDIWSYTGDFWKILDVSGNKVYHANCSTNAASRALLHVFGRNVVYEAKVKVNSYNATAGRICLIVRGNHSDDLRIAAEYTFSDQKWRLVERYAIGTAASTRATSASLPLGSAWNTIRVEATDATVSLIINGATILSASNFEHDSWGKLGLQVDYVDAYFDDIVYVGDGRVEKGVSSYTFRQNEATTDMVKLPNGKVIMDQGAVFESSDNGASWVQKNKTESLYKWCSGDMVVLQNGKLLSVKSYFQTTGYSSPGDVEHTNMIHHVYVSSDSGVTWAGPYPVQAEWKYRITMPNKLMQAVNGRIFFASGEFGNDGVWMYYSDDDGVTWTRSTTLHNYATFGVNLQEGKVVDVSGGNTLKAFFRTPLGALYESLSTDNGVNWGVPVATPLVSSLCAFNVERDPATGFHYVFWEYNDIGESVTVEQPRSRASLAASYDNTATWKFIMDLDDQTKTVSNVHLNHAIKIIDGNIWCQVPSRLGTTLYVRVYKVKTADVAPYVMFPPLHYTSF